MSPAALCAAEAAWLVCCERAQRGPFHGRAHLPLDRRSSYPSGRSKADTAVGHRPGDTVADMLGYVQLDPNVLLARFRDQVKETDLDAELQAQFVEEFESGL